MGRKNSNERENSASWEPGKKGGGAVFLRGGSNAKATQIFQDHLGDRKTTENIDEGGSKKEMI